MEALGKVAFVHLALKRTRLCPQLSAQLLWLLSAPPALHVQLVCSGYLTKGGHSSNTETMDRSSSPPVTEKAKLEQAIISHLCTAKDATLRAEINKIVDLLEASSIDEEVSTVDKSLFEVVRKCTSSDSPLRSLLDNHSRSTTRPRLMSNGYVSHAIGAPVDVWNAVNDTETQRDYVLVLRDINSDWCEALCTRYPDTIDRKFLLEHILGLELQLVGEYLYQTSYNSHKPLKEDTNGVHPATMPFMQLDMLSQKIMLIFLMTKLNFHEAQIGSKTEGSSKRLAVDPTLCANGAGPGDLSGRSQEWDKTMKLLANSGGDTSIGGRHMDKLLHDYLLEMATRMDSQTKKARGIHVNCWRALLSGDRGYRSPDTLEEFKRTKNGTYEEFKRTKDGWAKPNAFVSCCRLASNLCELKSP